MKYLMTTILLSFAFLVPSNLFGDNINKLNIEFGTNKFYSHYIFSIAVAGSPATSPTFKMVYEASEYAQKTAVQDAVKKIGEINTYYEYELKGYPKHRKNNVQLWQLLKIAAANSADVNDFSERISGMLPVKDMSDLIESLKTLDEAHMELVWKPNKEKLDTYLDKLRAHAKKGNFNNDFGKAAKFYGIEWNSELPFKVYILPVPAFSKGVYEVATPEGNVLTYAIKMRENPNLSKDLGVIFHELCHILYQNQPIEIQHKLEKLFLSNPSLYKVIAYRVMDEAFATALGQGWYYKQLEGKLDNEMWYAVEQINDVSKVIYSLVEEYANENKTLDSTFVSRYLRLYEDEFEEVLFEVSSNVSNLNLLMNESFSDPNVLYPYFFKNFSMRTIKDFNQIDEQNFNDWKDKLGTKMAIVDINSKSYEFLRTKMTWLPKVDKKKELLITKIIEGEHYYIILVSNHEQLGKAFELMNEKGKIKTALEEIEIE